jgi:uncharacterized membrane protein (UPF0127 family)
MDFKVFKGKKFLCKTRTVKGLSANVGLMFRSYLKKGESLTLELPKKRIEIHTFFVFFPIDLFFLDEDFRVIEKASMKPWRIYLPKKNARYLLEANKGELNLRLRDKLSIGN